jgi:hypothetical protein
MDIEFTGISDWLHWTGRRSWDINWAIFSEDC